MGDRNLIETALLFAKTGVASRGNSVAGRPFSIASGDEHSLVFGTLFSERYQSVKRKLRLLSILPPYVLIKVKPVDRRSRTNEFGRSLKGFFRKIHAFIDSS